MALTKDEIRFFREKAQKKKLTDDDIKEIKEKSKPLKLSEEERKALVNKKNHPERKIICPRCGNEILRIERGNSLAVECATDGCIFGGIRGL